MLNENHEPTRYYGVFRNFVETAIIPTTWREGGFAVQGNTARRTALGRGYHHRLQSLEVGRDFDAKARKSRSAPSTRNWRSRRPATCRCSARSTTPAFRACGSARRSSPAMSAQGQPGFDNNRVTLWEGHARWNPGNWDLSALYARGTHLQHGAMSTPRWSAIPTLIPEAFFGWYAEAAYRATLPNDWMLAPFARYEIVQHRFELRFDRRRVSRRIRSKTRRCSPPDSTSTSRRGVVLKIDYLHFDRDDDNDRVDLGLGYQF